MTDQNAHHRQEVNPLRLSLAEVSLNEPAPNVLTKYERKSTGEKYLIDPSL